MITFVENMAIMAYRDFRFSDLEEKFGIKQSTKKLFQKPIQALEPTAWLKTTLEQVAGSALTTEKALSEAYIFPILQEIRLRNIDKIQLFSGENLLADRSKGLNGECDFIFAKAPQAKELRSPIFQVTEAKLGEVEKPRNQAQASAQLIGARFFNETHGQTTEKIYGACTSGLSWIFILLEGDTIYVDEDFYTLSNLPELLGVLQNIVDKV